VSMVSRCSAYTRFIALNQDQPFLKSHRKSEDRVRFEFYLEFYLLSLACPSAGDERGAVPTARSPLGSGRFPRPNLGESRFVS